MTNQDRYKTLINRIQDPRNNHMVSYINKPYKNRLSICWHVRRIERALRQLNAEDCEDREYFEKAIEASLDQIEFLLNDQKWL